VDEPRRTTRRIRRTVDEPGLHASVVADVNVVVSTGGAGSARQRVRVVQRRSTRAAAPQDETKEQS
jgi:hypothetical protein